MLFSMVVLFLLELLYCFIYMQEMVYKWLTLIQASLIHLQWLMLWRLSHYLCVLSHKYDEYFFHGHQCPDYPFHTRDTFFNLTSFQSEWI
jgi:hypothetical protein